MPKRWYVVLCVLIAIGAAQLPAANPSQAEEKVKVSVADERQAVQAAVDQWFVVLRAMLNGDPKPFAELYSHADDVFYMGAAGTYRIGWDATYADWQAQAAKSTGGSAEGVNIRIIVNGDMATAAHYTKGTLRLRNGEVQPTYVRETSVFRKEGGTWKMIGHHADTISSWEKAFEQ